MQSASANCTVCGYEVLREYTMGPFGAPVELCRRCGTPYVTGRTYWRVMNLRKRAAFMARCIGSTLLAAFCGTYLSMGATLGVLGDLSGDGAGSVPTPHMVAALVVGAVGLVVFVTVSSTRHRRMVAWEPPHELIDLALNVLKPSTREQLQAAILAVQRIADERDAPARKRREVALAEAARRRAAMNRIGTVVRAGVRQLLLALQTRKGVLLAGIGAVALMALFPPWARHGYSTAGYRPILFPPPGAFVDWSRLSLQLLLAIAAVAAGIVVAKK